MLTIMVGRGETLVRGQAQGEGEGHMDLKTREKYWGEIDSVG